MAMTKSALVASLHDLGFSLVVPEEKKTPEEVMHVLIELVKSDDPRLIEGFPVVLAYSFANIPNIDLSKFPQPKEPHHRESLEKLLLASVALVKEEAMPVPRNLEAQAGDLEKKYGHVLEEDFIEIGEDKRLSVERLRSTFKKYIKDMTETTRKTSSEKASQRDAFALQLHLSRLFSVKQKEILLKKYQGVPLNKTEREYYSRKVKKKLEAIADERVRGIAKTLAG